MKPVMMNKMKIAWVIVCLVITVTAGTIYWHYYQPSDGASFKQVLYAGFSTLAVTGCTAAVLLCFSCFCSVIAKAGT
ncbi:hypothetical protein [Enterobacter ludwigii]|uniref:Uncharacterized protein n=1 Tax=Enterobacter ludwigii TaxID=299767 RepID=A0AAX3LIQ0_9ENTR|nr:hypothetical protein [Enterobacter ludwigii]WCE16193.1 hypothetical protein PHA72_27095 [Enterobacter ludwigii]